MAISKPNNYDSTPAGGDFTPVELGGHYLVIKKVSEEKSKTNKDMLKVEFDFSDSDKQAGYFMEQFRDDIRPDKKWPNQATTYILTEDSEGNCSRSFKTFITCVERSNSSVQLWKGNELNLLAFKDKKIGGVFGEQMDYYEGKEKKKRVLRWFTSFDRVADAQIPNIAETAAYKAHKTNGGSPALADGFMNIPDGIDEELPFN